MLNGVVANSDNLNYLKSILEWPPSKYNILQQFIIFILLGAFVLYSSVHVVETYSRLSTDSCIPIKLLYFGSKSYIFKHLLYSYKFSYILKIFPIFLGKFVANEYIL